MKTLTLLASLLLCITAGAQIRHYPYYGGAHSEWYLKQAAELLPQWYKQGAYDSILSYINTTEQATYHPYSFATRILVKMQQNRFDETTIKNAAFLDTLEQYAYMVRYSQQTTPAVSDQVGARVEDMPYGDRLYHFDAVWAKLLPETKHLDSTQTFLCDVIVGKVQDPIATIRAKRNIYPGFDSLLKQRQINDRNSAARNIAWGVGLWAPQGNAARLGVHPAINLDIGWRNKLNEVNLDMAIRFGRTPQYYTVLRQGTLYSRNYYTGGFIGLEYTRYLYHSFHFEAGLAGGIGYDGFSIAGDDNNHSNDYLKPLSPGSLNLNVGARVNYYFNSKVYLGLDGRFNRINYHNNGGSPIDGNAYSVTLLFGHN